VTDNTAQVSQIIDMQGFEAALCSPSTSAPSPMPTPPFAALLEEGDVSSLSDAATVANADMISESSAAPLTAAGFQFDSDNQVRTLGYIGGKRYIRLTLTPSANTGTWMSAPPACSAARHSSRRCRALRKRIPSAPPWTKARPLRAAPPLSP
jgi:hypothetical protein